MPLHLWYNLGVPVYDITLPISPQLPVWPGDPPVSITPAAASGADAGAGAPAPAVSRVCLSSHAGTHVDPPAHFFPGLATVDQLPLARLVGPAWVAQVTGVGLLEAADLAAAGVPPGTRRLLLSTANSLRPDFATTFNAHYAALSSGAARWLLDQGVELIGIDGPSIEPFDATGEPVHRMLLAAGVIIVENLALAGIQPGAYQLCCLPLPLAGGDGAPARTVLINE